MLIDFRDFIAKNWEFITALDAQDESDALLIDWLQANWEIIVEQQLKNPKIIFEFYGDGADNGRSSRIQQSEAIPTHEVVCLPKNGTGIFDYLNKVEHNVDTNALVFDRFVTMRSDGWYYEEPPFDKGLCYANNKEVIVNLDEIKFQLAPHC
ncbi:hypothetical protein N9W89_05095 [Hellea sp.]|nr:hypothetical protein [Hellea sp.]